MAERGGDRKRDKVKVAVIEANRQGANDIGLGGERGRKKVTFQTNELDL